MVHCTAVLLVAAAASLAVALPADLVDLTVDELRGELFLPSLGFVLSFDSSLQAAVNLQHSMSVSPVCAHPQLSLVSPYTSVYCVRSHVCISLCRGSSFLPPSLLGSSALPNRLSPPCLCLSQCRLSLAFASLSGCYIDDSFPFSVSCTLSTFCLHVFLISLCLSTRCLCGPMTGLVLCDVPLFASLLTVAYLVPVILQLRISNVFFKFFVSTVFLSHLFISSSRSLSFLRSSISVLFAFLYLLAILSLPYALYLLSGLLLLKLSPQACLRSTSSICLTLFCASLLLTLCCLEPFNRRHPSALRLHSLSLSSPSCLSAFSLSCTSPMYRVCLPLRETLCSLIISSTSTRKLPDHRFHRSPTHPFRLRPLSFLWRQNKASI